MLVIFCLLSAAFIIKESNGEVVLVQVIVRHSNRNPDTAPNIYYYYPNDPYVNDKYLPDGAMQLNEMGKQNAYLFGTDLQTTYKNLFVANASVYIQSVDIPRSIKTAESIAYGLHGSADYMRENITPPSIDVHIVPVHNDTLHFAAFFCTNYINDKSKAEEKETVGSLHTLDLEKYYLYLSSNTGVTHKLPQQSWLLWHQLNAQMKLGLELPKWTEDIFPEGPLKTITGIEYLLRSSTDRMKRLTGGVWIQEWLNHVDKYISGLNPREMFIYVGNDIHPIAILTSLGAYQMQIPDFTASVIFELHELNQNLYVKVLFKNSDSTTEILVPGCNHVLCQLGVFEKSTARLISRNIRDDCGNMVNPLSFL